MNKEKVKNIFKRENIEIRTAKLGNDAGIIGASQIF